MIKNNKIALLILLIIIFIGNFINFYPTKLTEVYNTSALYTDKNCKISLGYASSINSPMIYRDCLNQKDIKNFIHSLDSYSLGFVPYSSFKKFADLECYQITITNDKSETLFSACIRGNDYIFITSNDSTEAYETLFSSFNLGKLKKLYNSSI